MFSKKDDDKLKKARDKVSSLTDSLRQKAFEDESKMQRLSQQADSLSSSLSSNVFKKPSKEMTDDFSKLQELLENYKASLSTKAIPTPDAVQDEIKADKLLDDKIVYVDELLTAVKNKDFTVLAEIWTTNTDAIARHRDQGTDNSNSLFGLANAFIKPLYNQVVSSAGANLVAAMQPIYQDLEARAKAQQTLKP
ncbi:MAG: hypothetical protein V4501_08655 [Pseudomonadota bacterium]